MGCRNSRSTSTDNSMVKLAPSKPSETKKPIEKKEAPKAKTKPTEEDATHNIHHDKKQNEFVNVKIEEKEVRLVAEKREVKPQKEVKLEDDDIHHN